LISKSIERGNAVVRIDELAFGDVIFTDVPAFSTLKLRSIETAF